jgi:hypothetical protein
MGFSADLWSSRGDQNARHLRQTALPRAALLILRVGITQAAACVLPVAPPTPSQRHKGRITTPPRITTRRCDPRRFGIAPEATRRAGHRLGFHAVVRHALSLCVSLGLSGRELPRPGHGTAQRSRLSEPVHLIIPNWWISSKILTLPETADENAQ